jgi:bacteriocin-like protein
MRELTKEELSQISGGQGGPFPEVDGKNVSVIIFLREDLTEELSDNPYGQTHIYKEQRAIELTITGLKLS